MICVDVVVVIIVVVVVIVAKCTSILITPGIVDVLVVIKAENHQ